MIVWVLVLYVFAPVEIMRIYETYSTFQECERQAIGRQFLMSYRTGTAAGWACVPKLDDEPH
jgi:hypothetical protein